MTRLYLKIFLTFWLITASIIVGTNVVVHWFDTSPNRSLKNVRQKSQDEPAKQFLFQMAGSIINQTQKEVAVEIKRLPKWSLDLIYALDSTNQDLLKRPLEPGVLLMATQLNSKHPYEKIQDRNRKLFGRYMTLNDGNVVKLITISDGNDEGPDRDILWDLFINNIWPLLLVSVIISGTACFFLARYFTRSIKTLQNTIRDVSQGNLSARVSPFFSGRKDEIADLGKDFDQMTDRLEKAMLEQKRLIKDVSHELRTPLARLQIALALAEQRSQGTNDEELKKIRTAADYLGNVISEILALPVHDKRGWALDDSLDLIALLETIVQDQQQAAAEKNITLSFVTGLDEALVATHGNMLVGVFENIIRNAIHYTPINGRIDVSLSSMADEKYRTTIKDSGQGVPEEFLESIFLPFFRTDSARDRESGGHGLGLAIAHRSVALHYGEIWAKNAKPNGLAISVDLPRLILD